ncbi:DgyrCDS447 [Dimorphilus gyrociliatus]|uniref:DgyrCDS447 n=1 Tax=Dimorphilus gyrociliatus TaxID=2664684 RepID=A0A7I8V5V1_9ANNE|nr:DgyrCDS447 [Dimorphilus gyrociliatus]
MDSDGLPLVGPGIDYNAVQPIHQKRMLAFLNHFVSHTVQFLNRFSCVCEEKLGEVASRLERLENSLVLLENKIGSVPGLENVTVQQVEATTVERKSESTENPTDNGNISKREAEQEKEAVTESKRRTVAEDPRYADYVRMLKVGVPVFAIKQKMMMKGVDPNILDNLDAIVEEDGDNKSPTANDSSLSSQESDIEFDDSD